MGSNQMIEGLEGLEVHQAGALTNYILKCSLPILLEDSSRPWPLGTGTLFEIDDRFFLVTAAHVLTGLDWTKLFFPPAIKSDEVYSFGNFEVFTMGPECEVDVAVIELKSPDVIDLLRKGWNSLGLDAVESGTVKGRYIVGGYPTEIHTYDKSKGIRQSMFMLVTDPLDFVPRVDQPQPLFDQFFYHAKEGEVIGGGVRTMPRLEGASGASIWVYRDVPPCSLWSPQATLSVIGVQISAKHGEWFRGAGWSAVRAILGSPKVGLSSPI